MFVLKLNSALVQVRLPEAWLLMLPPSAVAAFSQDSIANVRRSADDGDGQLSSRSWLLLARFGLAVAVVVELLVVIVGCQ